MSNYQHFLITRINVDWNLSKSRSKEERNNKDFIDYRLNLFEKICYPSVKTQINKNFLWLILFDSDLPNEFRDRISKYNSEFKIIPLYINSKETFLTTLKAEIAKQTRKETTHIITTNVDSDDAISKNFVSSVQNQFRDQDFEFINFPFGYLYQLNKKKLFLREWLTSPFYTLIEKYENFETLMKWTHANIPTDKTSQIITTPVWLMTAHDLNVRTRFDVAATWQPLYRINKDFYTEIDFSKTSFPATLANFFTEINQVLYSKRKWDTPKVKSRKILNILFPFVIRFARKLKYHQ